MNQSRMDLAASAQFESVLAAVSARFVNLASDEVDGQIEAAQAEICHALDIDRSVLWRPSETHPGDLILTHVHQRSAGSPIVRSHDSNRTASSEWVFSEHSPAPIVLGTQARAFFPTLLVLLQCGQTLVIRRLSELAPDAARERALLEQFGTTANVTLPLTAGGEFIGALGFDMLGRERDWPDALVGRLRIVAQLFANVLTRQRSDLALRASEQRLRLAAAAAGAGVWDVDLASGKFWGTPEAMALYGFGPDEAVTWPRLIERVHPEDQNDVRILLEQFVGWPSTTTSDCRVVLPDGRLRWVHALGSAVDVDSANKPRRVMGVSVDVTERKRGELLLKATAVRLAAALDVAMLGSYERREILGPYVLDDRSRAMIGIPPGEERRAKEFWVAHIHPDDVREVIDQGQRMEAGQSQVSVEYRYLHPDGAVRWFAHTAQVLERDLSRGTMREVGVIQDITDRKRREEELRKALEEVRSLRDQLQHENVYLRHEVSSHRGKVRVIGSSAAIQRAVDQAHQVAPTRSTVLLVGETGTGKERFAEFIHEVSPRRDRTMVCVNCAAIPSALLESELFGREKGAYTGALSSQIGRFELAHRSTLFLDEIGDLPADAQVKLLRVLEERQFERLGSSRPVTVDVRIIAASNRDLEEEVAAGRFRSDLYYRLAVFPITLPPLRERLDDLPLLVEALVDELSAGMGKRIEAVSRDSIEALARYRWPGNIRELRNTIERALILANGPVLRIEPPMPSALAANDDRHPLPSSKLDDVKRDHMLQVLRETGWRIRGRRGAAEILGLNPTTLESRMSQLGIRRPGKPEP